MTTTTMMTKDSNSRIDLTSILLSAEKNSISNFLILKFRINFPLCWHLFAINLNNMLSEHMYPHICLRQIQQSRWQMTIYSCVIHHRFAVSFFFNSFSMEVNQTLYAMHIQIRNYERMKQPQETHVGTLCHKEIRIELTQENMVTIAI